MLLFLAWTTSAAGSTAFKIAEPMGELAIGPLPPNLSTQLPLVVISSRTSSNNFFAS